MSQQGGRPARHDDDWWGQLYDDSTEDTGPTPAPDSLDDRYTSARDAVRERPGGNETSGAPPKPGGTREFAEPDGTRGFAEPDGIPAFAEPDGTRDFAEPPPDRPPSGQPLAERPFPDRPSPEQPLAERPVSDRPPSGQPPACRRLPDRASPDPAVPPQRTPAPPGAASVLPVAPPVPPNAPPVPPGAASVPSSAPPVPPNTPSTDPGAASVSSGVGSVPPHAPPTPSSAPPVPPEVAPAPPEVAPPPPEAAPTPPGAASVPPSAPPVPPGAASVPPGAAPVPPGAASVPPSAPPVPPGAASVPPSAPPAPPKAAPAVASGSPVPPRSPYAAPASVPSAVPAPLSALEHVGSGPPTYDPEPTALPLADPDELAEQVADTALDGARYGTCTLRAVSLRGDSARYRGEPRRDALLTARFGTGEQALVLVAMATGARTAPGAHRVAAEACRLIGRAVGRSHGRLVEDLRAARRGELKSGLQRLTDRSLGRLRADAADRGLDPEEYTAGLRCLLLPADPGCRTRVFFGAGEGGLFRLRGGEWQDIEPRVPSGGTTGEPVVGFGSAPAETPEGDRLTMDFGIPVPPSPFEPAPEPPREPFRFRASVARPGDVLVMATGGLAEPLRGEPALCAYLARRWSGPTPPGLAAFLADAQVRVKGYADDRTAAAVWEA
ncbi:protein phosphatase 2C domain-containing protein [Streptomyces sp. NPDC093248]|uniref:protein phosphatase 2C domain-containing protein n=1 Tax=Streptomyces sp. NPDC093248 TaxID=3155072 RepID=UPI00342D79B1